MPLTDKQLYRVIDDVNSYYRITSESKKELLLNKYPNAAAAYSLRLLDGYYRGPLVRVRRDSDGAEVDVYPDYNNQLSLDSLVTNVTDANDTTTNPNLNADATFLKSLQSLGEFVSNPNYVDGGTAVDATVCVWYDQSSTDGVANENDAKQVTALNQPLIVSGGVVVTENGVPATAYNGTSQYFDLSIASLNLNNLSVHTVCRSNETSANRMQFTLGTNTDLRYWHYQLFGDDRAYYGANSPIITLGNADTNQHFYSFIAGSTSTVFRAFKDGVEAGSTIPLTSGTPLTNQQFLGSYGPIIMWSGTIQEFVVYSADSTNNRTGIEEDINNHYQIEGYEPQQPLIDLTQQLAVQNGDTIADGTPAAAYSLRTLSSTYTGPLVRVRRSTDNVEVDVYADSEGSFSLLSPITDGGNELSDPYLGNSSVGSTTKTKLYEFVYGQGCDLTVVTWYDQASGNDATQTTTGSQPKIYDSTTGVVTENGKPAVQFDGTNDHLLKPITLTDTGDSFVATFVTVAQANNPTSNNDSAFPIALYPNASAVDSRYYYLSLENTQTTVRYRGGNTIFNTGDGQAQCVFMAAHINTNSPSVGRLNGSDLTVSSSANVALNMQSDSAIVLGAAGTLASYTSVPQGMDGKLQEALYYNSDQYTTNRTGIESNINTYYSIY